MIKKILPIFLFLGIYSQFLSQNSCGFDQIHKEMLMSSPEYVKNVEAFEINYQNFAKTYRKRGTVYKIPIVIHVMETGTDMTKISDQQIKDAVKLLNEKYRKILGSNGDGNGVDIEFEFALSVRDPNNNCTSGINRVDMSKNTLYMSDGVKSNASGVADADLKSNITWNTKNYYNIWLVSEIDNNNGGSGTQGYAYFASSHGTSIDGAVILVNSFKNPNDITTAHELGHAFNLYHTFEGDLDTQGNSICPTNTDCNNNGDKVCDTPPHKRSKSDCVVGTNACDNNTTTEKFIHNYMDYSSNACANEFTAGQKVRMLAALTTNRSSFLESNGNMSLVPVISDRLDFTASSEFICSGNTVTFFDQTACVPNTYIDGAPFSNISYNWSIVSGSTTLSSTKQTPTFTLTNSGKYDVTLSLTTAKGTSTLTKKGFIIVGTEPKLATCSPTSKNNNGNFWQTVNNVSFNTISNTTDSYVNNQYTNFSCKKSTVVIPNNKYTFSATLRAKQYAEIIEAYIDYNDNGSFEDNEQIYKGSIAVNTVGTVSGTVTIPNNAVTDKPLRMRVFAEADVLSAEERNCTTQFFVGDVEDYTVYVSGKAASVSLAVSPSNAISYGTEVTFTATPTNGGSSPTYNWYLNDKLIVGQNNATYITNSLLDGDQVHCVLISDLVGVTNSPAKSNIITFSVTGVPISEFSANKISVCSGSSINFSDLSKLKPTSWSWTFQGGTPSTSTSQNPSVVYNTPGTYQVTLVASNANGTGTTVSKVGFISVYASPATICSVTRTKTPASGIGITTFNFNDISKISKFDDAAYQDFSCSNMTFLKPSTSYQVSVGTGSANDQWLRIYIDYNGDGDFADAGETVFSPANAKSSFSGTITTPSSPAKDKILRMRVISDFVNISPSACATLEYGQAEDFGIVFKSPDCTPPASPTVSVVQPSCQNNTGSVTITSNTSGLTFSKDGINYSSYNSPFTFNPGSSYSITAKNSVGCISSPVTGTISQSSSSTKPIFSSVNSICFGGTLDPLPTTSNNSIKGTWSPALDNTKTTTYTFTPDAGQCATNTTLTITVNQNVTPSFTQVSPICSGANLTALATTSTNNIKGSWTPALDNSKTTTYTFTPDAGQCGTSSTMTITVNPTVTTTFNSVNPICSGASLTPLPTTSNNNIKGSWSPALDNTKTTTYTFKPDAGQCGTTQTLTITVNANLTPTFTEVNPICSGDNLIALPTSSLNSFKGSWSPALDNTKTTTYTFKPDAGQCATTTTLTINVNQKLTPDFVAVNPICPGGTLNALPTTSTNNFKGTWSPALDNSKTTLYTFTPNVGECATTTTMTIMVNTTPVTPTFNSINSICVGFPITALPILSKENIKGSWTPALDNTKTTTYTFTPDAGQCANNTTLVVTVNPKVNPKFNAIPSICAGGVLPTLPTTSLNTIKGSWTPALDNTKTTIYTFTPDAGQCAKDTSLTFVVDSLPNPGKIQLNQKELCIGKSISLVSNITGGVWKSTNTKIATIDSKGLVSGLDSGLVQFIYTRTSKQCKDSTTATLKINNCASLDIQNKNEQISIYPNPTNNTLNLNLKGQKFEEYSIVDALGKVLIVGKITQDLQTINVSSLASGSYFLRVYSNENQLNYIFEKE